LNPAKKNLYYIKQFLSELYVFLIDELHKSLNDVLSIEDAPHVENNLTDVQQMRHFAFEAEMNQNYDLSAYYYQEVYLFFIENLFRKQFTKYLL
jgi:hypothetical protein